MDLCVKETLHSLHVATWPCKDGGCSPPQEAVGVTQSGVAVLLALDVKVEQEFKGRVRKWRMEPAQGIPVDWGDLYSCCPLLQG